VPLPNWERQLVYVYSASIPVLYLTANLQTLAKVLQVVRAQSPTYRDGTYVVPQSIDIGGLSLTPS
jgi:hypothetical protein